MDLVFKNKTLTIRILSSPSWQIRFSKGEALGYDELVSGGINAGTIVGELGVRSWEL
jgi:hypothetical protein